MRICFATCADLPEGYEDDHPAASILGATYEVWNDPAVDWDRYDPAVELRSVPVHEVLAELDAMAPDRVVVTGGEPLVQQRRLVPLLEGCRARGWPVEVETNGTIVPRPEVAGLVAQWNVSPKLANSGVSGPTRIRPDALRALAGTGRAVFKFVVADPAELDEVATLVAAHDLAPVWIMPEGTDPTTVLGRARSLADPVLARDWNLTTRLHVLLWGDERGR